MFSDGGELVSPVLNAAPPDSAKAQYATEPQ